MRSHSSPLAMWAAERSAATGWVRHRVGRGSASRHWHSAPSGRSAHSSGRHLPPMQSVPLSQQTPLQRGWPAGQGGGAHVPPSQVPLSQTVPQIPQLFGSLAVSTQVPPQSVRPGSQGSTGAKFGLHVPPSQV